MKMREVLNEDKKRVVELLSLAFSDNKSVNTLVKQDGLRDQRISWLMKYAFEECLDFGKVVLSDDDNACAIVLFRDRKRFSFRSLWRDIFLVFRVMGLGNLVSVMKKESLIKTAHAAVLGSGRGYYLWFIGVDPAVQGKGIGSGLLSELLADAIALGRVLLLETSTEANVPFYTRAGLSSYQLLDVGYPLYFFKQA